MIKTPETYERCKDTKHWEYRLIGWGCPTCDWPIMAGRAREKIIKQVSESQK